MASTGVGLSNGWPASRPFDESDGLADPAAQIVIDHQARVLAQAAAARRRPAEIARG